MADPNFDALEMLERAATSGPWYVRAMDDDLCASAIAIATKPSETDDNDDLNDSSLHGVIAATLIQHRGYVVPLDGRCRENAELIVAMRNALPELLRLARLGRSVDQA